MNSDDQLVVLDGSSFFVSGCSPAAELDQVAAELDGALEELREFARGIHPAILSEGGLGAALRTLARRSLLPVQLEMRTQGRLPEPIEVAEDRLRVLVRDDGVGGADLARGSGLVGLKDRVEALGGRILVESPRGAGTSVEVELPLTADATVGSG